MFTRLLSSIFVLSAAATTSLYAQWQWVDESQSASNTEIVLDVAVDDVRDVIYSVGYLTGIPSFPEISSGVSGMDDGFIMKYDLSGNVIWAFAIGGTGDDQVTGVVVEEATGNIFVTGYVEGNNGANGTSLTGVSAGSSGAVSGNFGGRDAFVAKYNVFGQLLWYRLLGSSGLDQGMDIAINATAVYVTGIYTNSAGISTLPTAITANNVLNNFVIGLDKTNGNTIWDAVMGSSFNDFSLPATVYNIDKLGITADDNGVYAVNYFFGATYNIFNSSDVLAASVADPNLSAQDFVVTAFSNGGAYNWSALYNNVGTEINGLGITSDCDGVYVTGTLHDASNTPGGTVIGSVHDNVIISKLNKTNGSEIWLKEFDSQYNHDDYFIGLEADGYGNLFAIGRLRGTTFSSGADFSFTTGAAYSEVMLAHYKTDGTFESFEVFPSTDGSFGMSVATYKDEKYVVGGFYNGALSFGSVSAQNSFDNGFVALKNRPDPISYVSQASNNVFCQSEENPIPTITVPSGGTFTGPAQVVFDDPSTGEIDLSSSTAGGPYTIVYSGFTTFCTPITAEFDIYILQDVDASFSFATDNFCINDVNPTPSFIAVPGGTFSASSGLSLANASTGKIDLAGSTPGGPYWLVYTSPGVCPSSDSIQITINAIPNADFGYAQTAYCSGAGTELPSLIVNTGGVFDGPAGLVINASTGEIDLDASTPGGPYTIDYLVNGTNCQNTASFDVTIVQTEDASFAYASTSLCTNSANVLPTSITTPGGTFFAPSGLTVANTSTGEIEISTSTPGGPYQLYYTTNGTTCPGMDSLEFTVTALLDPSFAYAQSTYCLGSGTVLPNVASPGGTFSGPAEVVFVSTSTGEIDLAASTPGGPYVITYTTPSPCQTSSTYSLTFVTQQDASFSYTSSAFCQNEPNPLPASIASPGGAFSGPSGLIVVSATGEIDVAASTPGGPYWLVYTTTGGNCPNSDSIQVSIEAAPDPSFAYTQSVYCNNVTNPLPSSIATTGGTFSAPIGLVINSSTGEIDLSASTVGGPYIVQYVVNNAFCSDSTTFSLTVDPADDATFSYATNVFCNNDANPFPSAVTTPGGTFSGSAGLVVDPLTGEIDVANSTTGVAHLVTYLTNGTCPESEVFGLVIEDAPDASFTYAQSTFCINEANPLPNSITTTGGTFTLIPGLTIDQLTGEIDLSSSIPGSTYTVEYIVSTTYCQDTATFDITINQSDDASFTYADDHFCSNEANPSPTSIATPGGVFSGQTGLVVDAGSGEIDVIGSIVGGPYWLVYNTSGLTCPASDSIQVYIESAPDPTFDYSQTSFCQGAGITVLPSSVITPGGTFNAPGGVAIDAASGGIDLDASTAGGPYSIEYTVQNTYCQKTYTFDVTIVAQDDLSSVSFAASDFCISDGNQTPVITGVTGGTFTGPTSIDIVNSTSGEISPSSSVPGGPYVIKYVTPGACPDSAEVTVSVFDLVTAYAGEDQELFFVFSSMMDADIPTNGTGGWSSPTSVLVSDEFDPNSEVSNLQLGENVFEWKVSNGVCPVVSDEVIIYVRDIFIPQAVTPNNDGKNDYFTLESLDESTCSMQIFNRWGQLVYENNDYQNEWNGQNSKGDELKNDTYFYTILINDSISYNGYVVLKK